ncbi:hypothetical protein QOT17_020672 [Balamuthia mandrillaris]
MFRESSHKLQIIYPSIYKKLKNSLANFKTNFKFHSSFIIHHCTDNRAHDLEDITGNILPDKVPLSAVKHIDPSTPFEDKHFEVEKVLNHDGPLFNHYNFMK